MKATIILRLCKFRRRVVPNVFNNFDQTHFEFLKPNMFHSVPLIPLVPIAPSENGVFKTQFKIFFISQKSPALFLRQSVFCILNHYMNFGSCDIIMSIKVEYGVNFELYLLNIPFELNHYLAEKPFSGDIYFYVKKY